MHTSAGHTTDQAGNVATNATYTFVYDSQAPTTLTAPTPVANAFYGGATAYPTNCAVTLHDALPIVSTVEVTLKDPAGNYWNGTTFTGTTESTRWQTTTLGAGTWS